MTRTYVFVKAEEGGGWSQRTSYQDTLERVYERMIALIRQDFTQAGKESMPWRVLLIAVDPERPNETKVVEYKVEFIEPRLVTIP